MLKVSVRAALCLALLCSACASTTPDSPEANSSSSGAAEMVAPGMIPASCEALLQKSQEWSYKPGEKWKPANKEQALEVADFFSSFTLVPGQTSRTLHAWSNGQLSTTPEEARKSMKEIESLQFCDHTLAMVFLDAMLNYPWPKDLREQASKALTQFILNQQSRTSLLESRAVTIHALKSAREKHLVSGSAASVAKLRAEIQRAKAALAPVQMAESETNDLDAEKNLRKELAFSERIRERLAQELPLP